MRRRYSLPASLQSYCIWQRRLPADSSQTRRYQRLPPHSFHCGTASLSAVHHHRTDEHSLLCLIWMSRYEEILISGLILYKWSNLTPYLFALGYQGRSISSLCSERLYKSSYSIGNDSLIKFTALINALYPPPSIRYKQFS